MGAKLTVTGIENGSTGYAWALNNKCGAKLSLVDDHYEKGGMQEGETGPVFGRPGRRTFKFVTAAASVSGMGKPCQVTFTYKRPWLQEPDFLDDVKGFNLVIGESQ